MKSAVGSLFPFAYCLGLLLPISMFINQKLLHLWELLKLMLILENTWGNFLYSLAIPHAHQAYTRCAGEKNLQ